jgi:hypothetical protein
MTIPDPRYPDGTGSADAGRPGSASTPDTSGAHAAAPSGSHSSASSTSSGSTSSGSMSTGSMSEQSPSGGSRPTTPTSSSRPSDRGLPEPEGPRTTGAGGHVLGVLVGLLLTPLALLVLTLGMSRILDDGFGAPTVSPDALGIALVTVGALLVALVALLAIWTSAVPFTGGLVALVIGAAYLFAPEASHRETVRLLSTEQNRDAVLNATGVGTSGTLFTLGLVLLAAGNAASIVRRRGIAVGSHRERTARVR